MSQRKTPNDTTITELMSKCRRRCCMCYSLDRDTRQKHGQVAHIDRVSSNSSIDNLAFLCLDHHNAYDSKMSQSKNYTPSELASYKAELELYIKEEWSKPVLNSEVLVDVFSGKYLHSRDNASSELTIKYIGGNVLQIQGMAYWGTTSKYGPNMGELDCIAKIESNKAIFKDKFHDGQEYILEITFLGQKILVEDNYIMGYYGNGVSFAGEYHKDFQNQGEFIETKSGVEVMNVAAYGCFTFNRGKKIISDSISEEINLTIQNSINNTSTRIYSYKNAILLHRVQIPKNEIITLNYEKLNEKIKSKILGVGHIASIHFLHSQEEEQLHVVVNYNNRLLGYSDPSENMQRLGNLVLNSKTLTRSELVSITLNLFYLVYSQVHLELMFKENDFKNLHYTLDGCEKLIIEIKSLSKQLEPEKKELVNQFSNFWQSHCERYRAITLASEKEYYGAVSSIFKAISLNPFYPYKDYASLKADYSKRYAVELIPEFAKYESVITDVEINEEENIKIAEGLWEQIEFKEASYHYVALKDIMYETQNNRALISFIEDELSKLDETIPFILITKSEVVRYLRKGWRWRRVNKMYYARLDETIEYLKRAIQLDSDLPVLYTKIGVLLFMKSFHSFFLKAKYMDEAMKMFHRGFHFLTQLGIKTRLKSSE